jgi:hypothetical protein
MDQSRSTFLSYWHTELTHTDKHTTRDAPPEATGALSAHLLTRDVRACGRGVKRLLLVGSTVELVTIAPLLLTLQVLLPTL